LQQLYDDLLADKATIGKMPKCDKEEFIAIIQQKKDSDITWDDFRFGLDMVSWKKFDPMALKNRINEIYKEGNKLLNLGKAQQAKESFYTAIRLENSLTAEVNPITQRSQSVEPPGKKGR